MNAQDRPAPIREFRADLALVAVFASRAEAGRAAALEVASELIALQDTEGEARVVFAAAPSQDEFLDGLAQAPGIAWDRLTAYHMDEYLGISPDHPASFRRYLREHLFARVAIPEGRLRLIPADSGTAPNLVCYEYETLLRHEPPHLVCAGIGENGHLAFNDPPVADFLDPVAMKVVRLDEACRTQQVHDGCFPTLDDVPRHAFTLTVPALLAAKVLSVVVPGPRKAQAVREALTGPISEACPASILRAHPGVRIYLDRDSAGLL